MYLGARDDFLAANEDVVRAGVSLVVLAWHRVEWTDRRRVTMQDVEVCRVGREALDVAGIVCKTYRAAHLETHTRSSKPRVCPASLLAW